MFHEQTIQLFSERFFWNPGLLTEKKKKLYNLIIMKRIW